MSPAHLVRRIGFYVVVAVVTAFFALPMLWLVTAPFTRRPGYAVTWPDLTVTAFRSLGGDAFRSLYTSAFLSLWVTLITVGTAALAAYALSRTRVPGRRAILYLLLLLSSVITGTAVMVPLYHLMFALHLLDRDVGVILVLTGGLLPAAIFMLKDVMDAAPSSREESARVFGANSVQVFGHVVLPAVRPGLAAVAVWAAVNVWGDFLMPFLLYRGPDRRPAAVTLHDFYAGGRPDLALISAFSLLYSIPVVIMFLLVRRRYGFRLHGGITA